MIIGFLHQCKRKNRNLDNFILYIRTACFSCEGEIFLVYFLNVLMAGYISARMISFKELNRAEVLGMILEEFAAEKYERTIQEEDYSMCG